MKQLLSLAFIAFLLPVAGVEAGTVQESIPCSKRLCTTQLTATSKAKSWQVRGTVGEGWLLYLNVYESGERLEYRRLAGGCDASYSSSRVSAILHACGKRSSLDYVSFLGPKRLRVEYRYVPR